MGPFEVGSDQHCETRDIMQDKPKRKTSDVRGVASDQLVPNFDDSLLPKLDSALRLVLSLIVNRDFFELNLRTGIKQQPQGKNKAKYLLPVLVELRTSDEQFPQIDDILHSKFNVPQAYANELKINKNNNLRFVSARIELSPEIFDGKIEKLEKDLALLLKFSKRVSLGVPGQPSLSGSRQDIGLPIDRKYKGEVLTGKKIVVGIIDDGAALAHWNFLRPPQGGGGLVSRIQFLWDQAGTGNAAAGWATPVDPITGKQDFDGLELTNANISAAINAHVTNGVVAEDDIYRHLGYGMNDLASHGTHVMDIAAGNGQSLMGCEGVAPDADIIFVQLPSEAIEGGALALWRHILDGVMYVFSRAKALKQPAVVNISYGGYDGPHDGTSELELGIDTLLTLPDRAVVIAAGNGFEADCHASAEVKSHKTSKPYRWIVLPEDPTPNDLEIWYDGSSALEVRVTSPGQTTVPLGWIALGKSGLIRRKSDNKIVGRIEHAVNLLNDDNQITVRLRATDPTAEDPFNAPSASGIWKVELRNRTASDVTFHAWISRDDSGRPAESRRRQSRFHEGDSRPDYTITGWATGSHTISVGAYNTGTQEVSRYSACGPTRPIGGSGYSRPKPDICAPAEEDVRRGGVLSASSRKSNPTRINGTSISAPHVAGIVALIFDFAANHERVQLTADQIRQYLELGGNTVPLLPNRHQLVDVHVPIKQADVWADLIGAGKVDLLETMKKLFP
jgi:subtilisin family serine protease